ncbi:hypothetical protein QFC20_003053 [Naganishia adeliensis]|uniref:Uncharacterized protein n=1 Tax=Naganishia adeliensis TaxID=92952 RepID=A0ACC2WH88_9TREE|nr:hypothetical protein QFC20_003053 [Naganishia adeliensis]
MANPPHPRFSSDPKLDYILLHTGLKVAETLSLAVPPAYLIFHAIRGKRPFSVNRFLGAIWMTSLGGAALSMPVAYYRLKDEPEVAMQNRMERLVTQVRSDDYSLIGSVLGSLVITTIFYKRASIINNILGGSLLGMSAGVYAHLIQEWREGREVEPDLHGMLQSVPAVGNELEAAKKAVGKKG